MVLPSWSALQLIIPEGDERAQLFDSGSLTKSTGAGACTLM